jgi:acyl-CoA dehydrogenase
MEAVSGEAVIPELSEAGRVWRERAARFVREELLPFEAETAERGELDRERLAALWERARALGFANLNMPREHGGEDLPMVALVAVEEESGKVTNGLGWLVADRGPRELLELATPEQVERYVAPVLRRETREAWAITEPGAGSDVSAIATAAARDGDEWVLNGEKWFVTGGDSAGFFVVLARAGEEQALFLVERDAPGLRITRAPRFMHDPYISQHVELTLTDCRVPAANRLPAGGADGARAWFAVERLMIAARCCGAAVRLLELARGWALEREAFGRPIADFQAIQFMLADSLVELAGARHLTYHAAQAIDRAADPRVTHGKISMAKLAASEMAGRVADRALQIFGGRGYMSEHPAERFYRELRVDRIWEGTSEIQRVIIARGLLKRGVRPYLP